jgi:tetratricopeptide (TPR) repeat protein
MPDRIQQLQAILEREPGDAFCLYGLAMEYAKLGRSEEAIAFFDRTLAANPDDAYAYFHKAKTLEQAGDTAAARQTLERGLEVARRISDMKAVSEIAAYLDELS